MHSLDSNLLLQPVELGSIDSHAMQNDSELARDCTRGWHSSGRRCSQTGTIPRFRSHRKFSENLTVSGASPLRVELCYQKFLRGRARAFLIGLLLAE
jgi:hypothetical protein